MLRESCPRRGHIILCPADLTSGLLGTNTCGIAGHEPAYARTFLKDAILWTLDGQEGTVSRKRGLHILLLADFDDGGMTEEDLSVADRLE